MFDFLSRGKVEPKRPVSIVGAEEIKTIPKKKNVLTITTQDKYEYSFIIRNWYDTNRLTPWIPFYKWYFGRNGDSYVHRYSTGEMMFRREDILRFRVEVIDD